MYKNDNTNGNSGQDHGQENGQPTKSRLRFLNRPFVHFERTDQPSQRAPDMPLIGRQQNRASPSCCRYANAA